MAKKERIKKAIDDFNSGNINLDEFKSQVGAIDDSVVKIPSAKTKSEDEAEKNGVVSTPNGFITKDRLDYLKKNALLEGEDEQETPDTFTSAEDINDMVTPDKSKYKWSFENKVNGDFTRQQIVQNMSQAQKAVYDSLGSEEEKDKYLYNIANVDSATPSVIPTGIDNDNPSRKNYAEEVNSNMQGVNTTNQHGSSSSTSTNFDKMNNGSSSISNIIENGIYGGTPLADAYKEINPEPVAPEYDPRREKALQWQKAIVSLGKLAGVIHDVNTVNNNGIVNQKAQGEQELSAIDAGISNLRSTFAQQYNDYLEADKLYRKELYQAYRQDIANKKELAKSLIPQYKESWADSMSFGDADNLAKLRAVNGRRQAASKTIELHPYDAPRYDENGIYSPILISEKAIKNLDSVAVAHAFSDPNIFRIALNKYAKDLAYDINGVDIDKLSNGTKEEVDQQINIVLANQDKFKVRERFQQMLTKFPHIAAVLLNESADNKTSTMWRGMLEKAGGLIPGTLSTRDQDFEYLVQAIAKAYPEEEQLTAMRNLSAMMKDANGKSNLIEMYNAFYGKFGTKLEEPYAPKNAGKDFIPEETRKIALEYTTPQGGKRQVYSGDNVAENRSGENKNDEEDAEDALPE